MCKPTSGVNSILNKNHKVVEFGWCLSRRGSHFLWVNLASQGFVNCRTEKALLIPGILGVWEQYKYSQDADQHMGIRDTITQRSYQTQEKCYRGANLSSC